jgi:hypothetical protein
MASVLLGRISAGTTGDFIATSEVAAWEFTASSSGTLKSIWLHGKAASPGVTDIEIGIYSDAGLTPNSKLASTTIATAEKTLDGPIVANFVGGVALVSGTQYWLALNPAGANWNFQGSAGSYAADSLTALPATWVGSSAGSVDAILWGEDELGIFMFGNGAVAVGTVTPATCTVPTHAAGDLIVVAVGLKPDTSTITTPAGWTAVQDAGGGGVTGVDAGPTRAALFYIEATGAGTTFSATLAASPNVWWCQATVYRKPSTTTWAISGTSGIDSTTGTPLTAAMGADPGLLVGDNVHVAACIPTDVTTPAQFTVPTLTGTGLTTAMGEIAEPDTTGGNDLGGYIGFGHVTGALTSGVPTFSVVAGGTTTNVRGPIILLRLRATSGATAYSLDCQPASFAVTGTAAGTQAGRMLNAASAAYAVTGAVADINRGFSLNAVPGSYTITGQQAGLLAARVLAANPGTYAVTGVLAGLYAGRALSADPGSFALTGVAADLVFAAGSLNNYVLDAQPGTFTLTGAQAALLADRIISVSPGVYQLTGLDAGVSAGRVLNAGPGAYTLTGAQAGVLAARMLAANPGSFTLTGFIAAAIADRSIGALPGSYTITGSPADVLTARVMNALSGVYAISGAPAGLQGPAAVVTEQRVRAILMSRFGIY